MAATVSEGLSFSAILTWDGSAGDWALLHQFPSELVRDMIEDQDGRWVAATSKGVFSASSLDSAWVPSGLSSHDVVAIRKASGSFVAATSSGLYSTADLTAPWDSLWTVPLPVTSLVVSSSGAVLVGTADGVFVADSLTSGVHASGLDGFRIQHIVQASDDLVLAAASSASGEGGYVFESSDLGASWDSGTLLSSSITDLAGGSDAGAVATSPSGVYRRLSPSSWKHTGTSDSYLWALESNAAGSVISLHSGNVSVSGDMGATWTRLAVPITATSLAKAQDGGLLLANAHTFYRASAHGDITLTSQLPGGSSLTRAIVETPSGVILVGTPADGVFRSTDGGATFGQTHPNLEAIDLVPGVDGAVWLATQSAVYRSLDSGESWDWVGASTAGSISRLILSATGSMFVVGNEEIHRSTDQGITWVPIGREIGLARSLRASADGTLFAGTSRNGVFFSVDDGATWAAVSNCSLPARSVDALAVAPDGALYIGTRGNGVYRHPMPSSLAVETVATPISGIRLDVVYPNPARSFIQIEYYLARPSRVTVELYDSVGREVINVDLGLLLSGTQQSKLQLRGVASGHYLLRARVNGAAASQPVVVQ